MILSTGKALKVNEKFPINKAAFFLRRFGLILS